MKKVATSQFGDMFIISSKLHVSYHMRSGCGEKSVHVRPTCLKKCGKVYKCVFTNPLGGPNKSVSLRFLS